jgi:hypothetical protein
VEIRDHLPATGSSSNEGVRGDKPVRTISQTARDTELALFTDAHAKNLEGVTRIKVAMTGGKVTLKDLGPNWCHAV